MELLKIDFRFPPDVVEFEDKVLHLLVHNIRKLEQTQQELQNFMSDINSVVKDVQDAVATGFSNVDQAIAAETDRVAELIKAGDTSAATAALEAMKSNISSTMDAEVAKINSIAPAPASVDAAPAPADVPAAS